MENSKLQFEHKNIENILPPLDLTPVGPKTSDIKNQQWNIQHVKKNHKNTTHQRSPIQTQVSQNHFQAILIRPMTEIINVEDVIKIERIRNARKRTLSNDARS